MTADDRKEARCKHGKSERHGYEAPDNPGYTLWCDGKPKFDLTAFLQRPGPQSTAEPRAVRCKCVGEHEADCPFRNSTVAAASEPSQLADESDVRELEFIAQSIEGLNGVAWSGVPAVIRRCAAALRAQIRPMPTREQIMDAVDAACLLYGVGGRDTLMAEITDKVQALFEKANKS